MTRWRELAGTNGLRRIMAQSVTTPPVPWPGSDKLPAAAWSHGEQGRGRTLLLWALRRRSGYLGPGCRIPARRTKTPVVLLPDAVWQLIQTPLPGPWVWPVLILDHTHGTTGQGFELKKSRYLDPDAAMRVPSKPPTPLQRRRLRNGYLIPEPSHHLNGLEAIPACKTIPLGLERKPLSS